MPGNILIDALDFMEKNIVVPHAPSIGTTQAQSGIKTLCITPATPGRQHSQDIPRWALTQYRGQPNAEAMFQAFWCPYAQNDTMTCALDGGAALCFTPTMDGCTFGFQDGGGHGLATVAHANEGTFGASREATYGMQGARQFQADEQANRIGAAIGDGATLISPGDYRADYDGSHVMRSTTFGIRTGGAWHFYTQRYLVQGGVSFLRGVTQQF